MFPSFPNSTELDDFDYHMREVYYHTQAVYELGNLVRKYLDLPDWRERLGTVRQMNKLQADHSTMAKFHVRMMWRIGQRRT